MWARSSDSRLGSQVASSVTSAAADESEAAAEGSTIRWRSVRACKTLSQSLQQLGKAALVRSSTRGQTWRAFEG